LNPLSNKKITGILSLVLSVFWVTYSFCGLAQPAKAGTTANDTTAAPPAKNKSVPAPYSKVIPKDAFTQKGLFTIHEVEGKIYFEIPDSLLDRDLLMVNRILRGAADSKLYAGDENNKTVIHFEKGPRHSLLLRKILYGTYTGDSTSSMYQDVIRSSVMPVIGSFPIETYGQDSTSVVINMTDYILGDNESFSLNPVQKMDNHLGVIAADKSFLKTVRSFPENIEIGTFKTYSQPKDTQVSGLHSIIPDFFSLELNTSIVLLPVQQMQQRWEDPRIGYFSIRQTDYDGNPNGVKNRQYIKRWRLEPKQEDRIKYAKGELVEPRKPIVFYIDPATPQKWVPYLIQAVNDWEPALEQAGFKNAIMAKPAPGEQEDSTWSIDDARHSAIVYKPSEIENAVGNSISDPRTGEILESHIDFYHNIIQLVHDWYMVQCGAVDTNAQKMVFDDSLTGKLIQAVITHEVGHALGLTHNMGASSTVPVDSLRDKAWVEANGICPSIMDYARFNYVAQPEDHISEKGLIMRIGVYDKWAVEWGYRVLPQFTSPREEQIYLQNWVTARTKDKRLWFGSEHNWGDPRIQKEDIGDNAVKAGEYGIKNLKRMMPRLLNWSYIPGDKYDNLNHLYGLVFDQYFRYLSHVLTTIGGIYETMKLPGQPGPIYSPEPKAIQEDALQFINKNAFTAPQWLLDTVILNRTGHTSLEVVNDIYVQLLRNLFIPPYGFAFDQMVSRNESTFGDKKIYTASSFLNGLKKTVWTELSTHQAINLYRRTLQKTYLMWLLINYNRRANENLLPGYVLPIVGGLTMGAQDIESLFFGHLTALQKDIQKDIPFVHDDATKFHLEYLSNHLEAVLDKNKK
jgi:hypothetical protein